MSEKQLAALGSTLAQKESDALAQGATEDELLVFLRAERVEHLLYIAEYKRHQSAPGPKLGAKAFWLDRRYPIASSWRDREDA